MTCVGCPNWKAKPIATRGRTDARLIIVRDHAYGQSFNQREAGWDDESLDILDWLIDRGVHESDVVFVTLVGCPGTIPNSRLVACAARLETLLAGFDAEFVLAVGQAPALAVGIAGPVERTRLMQSDNRRCVRGRKYAGRTRRIQVIEELHGASKKTRERIEEDVKWFGDWLLGLGGFDE